MGAELRRSLRAPPGHAVLKGDMAQIEARLNAWINGCNHLVDAFAAGEDVYSSEASGVFGYQVSKKTHPVERFIGKTMTLGLGYQMGAAKFHTKLLTDARVQGVDISHLNVTAEFAEQAVYSYRQRNHQIKSGWYWLGQMIEAVWSNPNATPVPYGPCLIEPGAVLMPNRLRMLYHDIKLNDDGEWTYVWGKPNFRHKLYGGKFLENIVQSLSRVQVMDAAVRLSTLHRLDFATQEHDALAFVVAEQDADSAGACIRREMERRPAWGLDIPLAVELGAGPSYGEAKEWKAGTTYAEHKAAQGWA